MTEMADDVASEIQRLNADVTQSVEDFNNNSEEALSAPLSVIIFGATGNLAREKLYPALQQLMLKGFLPYGSTVMACVSLPII